MLAIIVLLLAAPNYPDWIWQLGFVLIHLAAILSVYSMFQYFRRAWPKLRNGL